MDEHGDLQMSFSELADLVVKLVSENERQRRDITRLECAIDSLEYQLARRLHDARITAAMLRGSLEIVTDHPDRTIRSME